MNNSYGVVHTFEETPILLTQLLLQNKQTKRSKLLKEKLVYDPPIRDNNRARAGAMKSKSAFYVLKLPACTKAIKIGRANAYHADGVVTRLGEYKTAYGNAKIIYLQTFEYDASENVNGQPSAVFEKKVKQKLRANGITVVRGTEYYPNNMLEQIKEAINNVDDNADDNQQQQQQQQQQQPQQQPQNVRRSARIRNR